MPPVGLLGRPRAFGLPKEILMSMSNGVEGCEMAAKKPVKQKKAKDLDIGKTKGGEAVKGAVKGGAYEFYVPILGTKQGKK